METVLTALAACTAMDVISIALKKRQPVVTYQVHVRGEQRLEYRRFSRGSISSTRSMARGLDGGDRPLHRAVGDEVLPGQRDARRRRHRDPSHVSRYSPGQPTEEAEVLVTGSVSAARHRRVGRGAGPAGRDGRLDA